MAKSNLLGSWAFLIGLVIAVIVGLEYSRGLTEGMLIVLVIIGIIVGLLNVADKEIAPFLLSGLALVIVSSLSKDTLSTVKFVGTIFKALTALFVPATAVVAIKNVFQLARR